jgi:hypothetical protein
MSDESNPKVSRRDTLKLATAVSALGVGLGVVIDSKEGHAGDLKAEGMKLEMGKVQAMKLEYLKLGPVSLKLYKLNGDGKTFDLLHTLDLSALFVKGEAGQTNVVALKLFSHKADQPILISGQEFHIIQGK